MADFLLALADFDANRRWQVELAKVITPENRLEILPRFFHTSKKEAKEISAEIRPQEAAPHRLVVTTLKPASSPSAALTPRPPELPVRSGAVEAGPALESPRVRPDEPPRARLPMVESQRAAPPAVEPRDLRFNAQAPVRPRPPIRAGWRVHCPKSQVGLCRP
jgi:hypothetical protein